MSIQRRKEIVAYLGQESELAVEELAQKLEVSEVTVRRDLADLENQGLITRTRGGAALPLRGIEPMFNQRRKENLELKQKIAKYAASQIQSGEVVALDIGTTTAELAKELVKRDDITVFTSSFQVASILAKSRLQVYMIGGYIRKLELSMVGSIALETIRKFNFDRFYMGLASVCDEGGPTDYCIEEAEVKRAFIERSKKVIALVDKTKFGSKSLVKICDFEEIDQMVTNNDAENLPTKLLSDGKITMV
jgi:DeoR/GlpR family transcriptional regulator of sugar metabolism